MNAMNQPITKFKNIEFLRFIFAWAIVGFHIVVHNSFDAFGLKFLTPYLNRGWYAVAFFFVISFFFLVLKTKPEYPFIRFFRNKWLRLAPLVIVSTGIYYILHCCGCCLYKWNWMANIENCLLIRDWSGYSRWGQNLGPAWYCCVFLLISVFYLGLIKAVPKKTVPFIIGVVAYFSWRFYVSINGSAHPSFGEVWGTEGICRGLFCLGIGYLLAEMYTPPPYVKISTLKLICYTVLEATFLVLIVGTLMFGAFRHVLSQLLVIFLFAGLFWLFVHRAGLVSRLLERDICAVLGKYSFGIFIMHRPIVDITRWVVLPHCKPWAIAHPWLVLGGMAVVIMLVAILAHHFVEAPIMRLLKSKENKLPAIS